MVEVELAGVACTHAPPPGVVVPTPWWEDHAATPVAAMCVHAIHVRSCSTCRVV